MKSEIKNFLNDPSGFRINRQHILDFGMTDISQQCIGKSLLSSGKLGMECSFHFAAGVLCEPFVEKVLKRHKIQKAFLGILVFSHRNVADLLFREHKFQIVVHHHVFSTEAAEVFGHDAVNFSSLHIVHYPLEIRTLEVILKILLYDAAGLRYSIRLIDWQSFPVGLQMIQQKLQILKKIIQEANVLFVEKLVDFIHGKRRLPVFIGRIDDLFELAEKGRQHDPDAPTIKVGKLFRPIGQPGGIAPEPLNPDFFLEAAVVGSHPFAAFLKKISIQDSSPAPHHSVLQRF